MVISHTFFSMSRSPTNVFVASGLGAVHPDSAALNAPPTSGAPVTPPVLPHLTASQVLRTETTSQVQPSKTPSGVVNDASMGKSMGLASVVSDGEAGEDPFASTENNMSDEDRQKAVAWAAAAAGVEHVGFLPEAVLKTGFRIKIFKIWVPLHISIDYQNRRLTFICPDTLGVCEFSVCKYVIEGGPVCVHSTLHPNLTN